MIKASKDMEKLGIDILSCNIQNVTDEHGLIQDLGMDNTSKIRKDASIATAEAERDITIAQAAADNAANDARVAAETEIAQKNNELAIKKGLNCRRRPIQKSGGRRCLRDSETGTAKTHPDRHGQRPDCQG